MRDNWAAEWDKNARILGTTARFTLEELPRLIGNAENDVIEGIEGSVEEEAIEQQMESYLTFVSMNSLQLRKLASAFLTASFSIVA